jgi:hypothetical protein
VDLPDVDSQASDRVRSFIDDVIDTSVAEPFGAYAFSFDDIGAAVGRVLERKVFLEAFGNTTAQLNQEYGIYESSSIFFCVIDHRRGLVAGVMRMIIPAAGGPGLKSLADLQNVWGRPATDVLAATGIDLDVTRMWDIATLAVAPEYRTAASVGLVSLGLYQSFVRTAEAVGVNSLIMILDHIAFRMLRVRAKVPFIALVEGRPYLGSVSSIPALLQLVEWRNRLQTKDPDLLDVIFEGHGIEPALRQIDLDLAAACVERSMADHRVAPQTNGVKL